MPSLSPTDLLKLADNPAIYPNFVETGTYMGDTVFRMEPIFKQLYTIEINPQFYQQTIRMYHKPKIQFILGDSSEQLNILVPKIIGPTIFFLDGHWSASNTGRGSKDCPLIEEVTCITNLHKDKAIIIVDDVRLFGCGPNTTGEICNWENISVNALLTISQPRLHKFYFLPSVLHPKDRLVIHLFPQESTSHSPELDINIESV